MSAEQIVCGPKAKKNSTLKELNQKYSQDAIAGYFSHECALKIAGRTVGNIREIKSESNFYGMLPAEGQKTKEVNIYGRTCDVVSNIHY